MNQDVGGRANDWGYHIYNIGLRTVHIQYTYTLYHTTSPTPLQQEGLKMMADRAHLTLISYKKIWIIWALFPVPIPFTPARILRSTFVRICRHLRTFI
jgi:hypothetical protein